MLPRKRVYWGVKRRREREGVAAKSRVVRSPAKGHCRWKVPRIVNAIALHGAVAEAVSAFFVRQAFAQAASARRGERQRSPEVRSYCAWKKKRSNKPPSRHGTARQSAQGVVKRSVLRSRTRCKPHGQVGNPRGAGARVRSVGWQKSVGRILVYDPAARREARRWGWTSPKETSASLTRAEVAIRRNGARAKRDVKQDGTQSSVGGCKLADMRIRQKTSRVIRRAPFTGGTPGWLWLNG